MKNVLRVEGLKKSFRKHPFSFQRIEVLHGLDFEVKAGTVTGYSAIKSKNNFEK